ncbi:MAG: NAD(P)-dependent oxidoreductase [Armatimonadetes bacterium]|nr:NAD(P)-dependent oxidoreductase [Armatimonadota bacterium]
MHLLVTGGSGKVGRRLLPLLAAEHDLTVFDLVLPPTDVPVRFRQGDLLDSAALLWALRDCDAVLHLAAIPAPGGVSDDRLMQINVLGTQRLVEAAALSRPAMVIMASSDSVSGMVFSGGEIAPAYVPIDEDHPVRPRDAYGLSKFLGEEICRRYTRATDLITVCLRYCWVFWEEHYEQLPAWQAGDPHVFRGQMWGYIDVRDIGRAVLAVLSSELSGHHTFVLRARRNFMNRPTLDLVRDHYGPQVHARRTEPYDELPDASAFDYSRLSNFTGWEPVHDWQEEVGKLA